MASAKLIGIWSAGGSAGKSSIALGLAAELAAAKQRVLLIDADIYSPSLALMLGLVDHSAGLAAACRIASQDRFNQFELERFSVRVPVGSQEFSLMTGISSSSRWPEVSAERFENLLESIREEFDFIICDLASNLEVGLRQQGSGQERNALTQSVLKTVDQIIGICIADQVGISRYLQQLPELTDLRPKGEVYTLVNRLRSSVLGANAKQQISETLARLGQVSPDGFIPDDSTAFDLALKNARPISLAKRGSAAKQAIELFARTQLLGQRSNLDKRLTKLG
ncbi:P-loop NTPase [Rhodoluna sp.]|uniref:AAA family ATPase n=1 Tax=Rhodoluna sp. TaxID=1969481 RepID=UPI0025D08CE0|nr:P-loop NTPase [Rhodoluna sp.]